MNRVVRSSKVAPMAAVASGTALFYLTTHQERKGEREIAPKKHASDVFDGQRSALASKPRLVGSALMPHSSTSFLKASSGTLPSVLATSTATSSPNDDGGYPNFTKYHRSLLQAYLTPQLWEVIKDRRTSNGVTIEDIIRSGMALPYAHDPPRGIGLLAGDAESYRVFAPLFDKVIKDYHSFGGHEVEAFSEKMFEHDDDDEDMDIEEIMRDSGNIQKHYTDINAHFITSHTPDPNGEYILSTRIRVARSISGFPFSPCISRADRKKVEKLVVDSVTGFPGKLAGTYIPILSMTNDDIDDLVQRHILFQLPDEWAISAGLGRDWPDARGVFVNVTDIERTPDVIVWCNEEDHVRIMCMKKGGDIKGVFTTLSRAVRQMEGSLQERGHKFVHDERLGYLNSCPTNIGTALRASVHVKLIRLGKLPGFDDMVRRMHLEARGKHGELDKRYTGIFDISNAERLGKSEVQLINIMIEGVGKLIELEKKLQRGEEVDCTKIAC